MDDSQIIKHFEGKTMFVCGTSGFLAKIFLEKILRLQPKLKKIFLLLRSYSKKSVEQRLQEEILSTELFRVLREKCGTDMNSFVSAKIIPVPGDISYENLGIIDSELRNEILKETDIIVNSAATTKFDERYDVAFKTNALGAMHVENFARKCTKLDMLLHVSTAYVHGNRVGLIPEKPFQMGETLGGAKISHVDINREKKIVEQKLRELQIQNATEQETTKVMKDLGIERAMLHGWPNTYVFTKAMGEMLVGNFKENGNVIIMRPPIITSTYAEPFPGWIEGLRTLDSIFLAYGSGKVKVFVGDSESVLDMIPGDMVVNYMLAAIASYSKQPSPGLLVYHIGSSLRNHLKFVDLKWIMYHYLIKYPLLDDKGKPFKVGKPETLDTIARFHKYIAVHYMPYVKALKLVNMIFCHHFESPYINARRRINKATRLVELYKPYLFFQGIFDDDNMENLRSKVNVDVLNFDPKCIHWEEYFLKIHFHGIRKYVLK